MAKTGGGTLKTCNRGHQYEKSSDCPVCPICDKEDKPDSGFLSILGAPARRALEKEGISSLQQLSAYREKEILKLHGIGPSSMPKLRAALANENLSFRSN